MQKKYSALLIFAATSFAQSTADSTLRVHLNSPVDSAGFWERSTFIPVLAYAPDTKLQFGALWVYRLGNDPQSPSRAEWSVVGTQNKQLKSVLYLDQWTDVRHIQNTLEYRSWPTHYYLAQESGVFRDPKGTYDSQSFEYEGSVEQKLARGFWMGLGWNYRQSESTWPDSLNYSVRPKLGGAGGVISGPELLMAYDLRDHVLEPHRGIYSSLKSNFYLTETMSDFNFSRHAVEFKFFVPLAQEWTWATNLGTEFVLGDVPYYALATTDGAKKLRGVDRGVILGRKVLQAQSELRFPLMPRRDYAWGGRVWNHLNGVLFADGAWAGTMTGDIKQNWLPSYGLGLRWALDTKQKTYLRFDGAIVDGALSPVVYIREAF